MASWTIAKVLKGRKVTAQVEQSEAWASATSFG